jgi:hypothetical protein
MQANRIHLIVYCLRLDSDTFLERLFIVLSAHAAKEVKRAFCLLIRNTSADKKQVRLRLLSQCGSGGPSCGLAGLLGRGAHTLMTLKGFVRSARVS